MGYISNFKHLAKEKLLKAGNKHIGNRNYNKFVIITRARTGSNYLVTLLASHLNIHSHGELFNKITDKNCSEIWNDTFSKRMSYVKYVGFKIFYDHPIQSDDKEVWDLLLQDKKIRIIHLKRENLVRAELSLLIARKTQTWGITAKSPVTPIENKKITVDVNKFKRNLERTRDGERRTKKMFFDHPFFELTYEDLIADRDGSMDKIFKFLNVKSKPTYSNFIKQNTEPLSLIVQNLEELKKELQDTEFQSMLK